jgi:hypothetical protein
MLMISISNRIHVQGTSCLAIAFSEGRSPHKFTPVPGVHHGMHRIGHKAGLPVMPMFYGGEMIEEKVNRNVFEVVDMHESDDTAYWRDQSYIARIETIEFMRKVMFGHDRVSERLQRILTVAELKEN